jgi:hypothetical protein
VPERKSSVLWARNTANYCVEVLASRLCREKCNLGEAKPHLMSIFRVPASAIVDCIHVLLEAVAGDKASF